MSKLRVFLLFKKKSTEGRILFDRILNNIPFNVSLIQIRSDTGKKILRKFNKENLLETLIDNEDLRTIELSDLPFDNPNRSDLTISINSENYITVDWMIFVSKDLTFLDSFNIDEIVNLNGFIEGYATDWEDFFWQNTTELDNFKRNNRPFSHLKLIDAPAPFYHRIDITNNPGGMLKGNYLFLISSWKMWFGKPFYEFVSKDKLLNFKEAFKKEELSRETVFIELYPDPFSAENASNRKIQQAFKDYIDFNSTVTKIKLWEKQNTPNNPYVEISDGKFEHGGIHKIIQYFDENGNPITKSMAKQKEEIEYDSNKKVVWRNLTYIS